LGADGHDAPRRLFTLHAQAIQVRKHTPEQRPDEPIARIRSVRDTSVDDDGLDAGPAALAEQVRPDLPFDEDDQCRPYDGEHTTHDEREIEREVEHAV